MSPEQLKANYREYQLYFERQIVGNNCYHPHTRKLSIVSTSRYVAYHEIAHSIQHKHRSRKYMLHQFFLHVSVLLPFKVFKDISKHFTFKMEEETCRMAICMLKCIKKWDLDEATLAYYALSTYAYTEKQKQLVDKIDWSLI